MVDPLARLVEISNPQLLYKKHSSESGTEIVTEVVPGLSLKKSLASFQHELIEDKITGGIYSVITKP